MNKLLLTSAANGRPQNTSFFTDLTTTSLNLYSLTVAPTQMGCSVYYDLTFYFLIPPP
jgi:hypothetical protein